MAGAMPVISSTSGFSMRSRNCRAYADSDSMYRLWPSAYSVSNARLDFPDPETPVTTVIALCGMVTSMVLRLWTRAPRTRISSASAAAGGGVAGGRTSLVGSTTSVGSVGMSVNKKLYAWPGPQTNGGAIVALSRVSVESGYKSVSHDCFLRHAFVPQPANSSLRPVHCEPHPGSQENGPDSAASA